MSHTLRQSDERIDADDDDDVGDGGSATAAGDDDAIEYVAAHGQRGQAQKAVGLLVFLGHKTQRNNRPTSKKRSASHGKRQTRYETQ